MPEQRHKIVAGVAVHWAQLSLLQEPPEDSPADARL